MIERVFGGHKISASHRLDFFLYSLLERCNTSSHLEILTLLKEGTLMAQLILNKLFFAVFLFLGERPRGTFVPPIKMIGIVGELSIRETIRKAEITFLLPRNRCESICGLGSRMVFLW